MTEKAQFGGSAAGKLGLQAMQEVLTEEQRRLNSVKGGKVTLRKHGKGHYRKMADLSARTSHLSPDERSAIAKKAVEAREKRRKRKKK